MTEKIKTVLSMSNKNLALSENLVKEVETRRSSISFSFTLVVDVLSRLVSRAVDNGLVKGLTVGREQVLVSHLQFTDDNFFFGNQKETLLPTFQIF